jgi:hypothetical protein
MNRLLPSVITLIFLFAFLTSAQEHAGAKVLTIVDNPVFESPLSLDVYIYGKKIKSDVPFNADENWLGDLQIIVTNRTDEEIKFVSLILDFPTEHNGEPMYKRYRINYSRAEAFKTEEDDPEIEVKRIGKKDTAVITFNSNKHDSFEQFKFLKQSSAYDPKIWDHGILSVGTVEFESRAWYMGYDFDKKANGKWEKNKEKEQKLIERIKKDKQERESKIGYLKKSFLPSSTPKAAFTCYTVSSDIGSNFYCTAAAQCPISFCKYFKPDIIPADSGANRYHTSPVCKKDGAACGCCEPLIYDLALNQPACSTE